MILEKEMFEESESSEGYAVYLDNMTIEIDELEDRYIKYANELANSYEGKLGEIATKLLEFDTEGYFESFDVADVSELKDSLGNPDIKVVDSPNGLSGVLTWLEHDFDEHIISVEFNGCFENLDLFSIDG